MLEGLAGRPRIGTIGFTNAAPFRLVAPKFDAIWTSGDPSELAARMELGELDACLLPTGAFERLEGLVRPVGPYGIGCRGQVLSVRLFSKERVRDLLDGGRSIYMTPRTSTTRMLVSELFGLEYGRRPRVSSDPGKGDARVLIGDEAMDCSREEFRWPVAKDIGEWWYEQTSLPFVFAQWVVRRSVSERLELTLRDWIEENLAYAASEPGKASLRKVAVAAGWTAAMGDLYFERLDYRLGEAHFEGLARFLELMKGTSHGH